MPHAMRIKQVTPDMESVFPRWCYSLENKINIDTGSGGLRIMLQAYIEKTCLEELCCLENLEFKNKSTELSLCKTMQGL